MAIRVVFSANLLMGLRLLCCLCLFALVAPAQSENIYGSVKPSQGGTGKTFAGREIASVMSWRGAGWLERPERQAEERPDLLLDALDLKPGLVVADVGTGSGYYARRLAAGVGPKGKVYAVDTQADMLALLKKQQTNEGQGTIVPVLSSETALGLPERSLDLAILVDVYHELLYPVEVMTSLAASMKPGGQIVLIEYRAEDPAVPIKTLHKMSEAQIKKEAALLGLVWVKTIAVLPWQHLVILKK